jgi:O-acetyl-ADP-ribose deacetylase (regulator of RNase III)
VRGDIVEQDDVDAVVNAANAQLASGGGVAGAIHAAAGPGLYEECKPLAPIKPGEGVITSGHRLRTRWCIHVLGPVYNASRDPARLLASCYDTIVTLAEERSLARVATPAISTGIFGYPVDEAADVALDAVISRSGEVRSLRLVRFVLWSESDLEVHAKALERRAG